MASGISDYLVKRGMEVVVDEKGKELSPAEKLALAALAHGKIAPPAPKPLGFKELPTVKEAQEQKRLHALREEVSQIEEEKALLTREIEELDEKIEDPKTTPIDKQNYSQMRKQIRDSLKSLELRLNAILPKMKSQDS